MKEEELEIQEIIGPTQLHIKSELQTYRDRYGKIEHCIES